MCLVGDLWQADVALRQRVSRQHADGGVELLLECVKKGHIKKSYIQSVLLAMTDYAISVFPQDTD